MNRKKEFESEALFEGTVAWSDPHASNDLARVVNSIVNKSATIFLPVLDFHPSQLIQDCQELHFLCNNFIKDSQYEDSIPKFENEMEKMQTNINTLENTLINYQPKRKWTNSETQYIASSMKRILGCLQAMMDISEVDQTRQTLQHMKFCVEYQNKLWNETPNPQSCSVSNFITRSNNFIDFHDTWVLLIENRIDVTKDNYQVNQLRDILDIVKPNVDYIKDCCYRIRQNHNMVYLLHENNQQHFVDLREGTKRFIIFIKENDMKAKSNFDYQQIEPEKFNYTLDELVNAINRGEQSTVLNMAKDITGQVNGINDQFLMDAQNQLKEQTKDLIATAKKNLQDNQSLEAKNKLNDIVNSMKKQISNMANLQEVQIKQRDQMLRNATGVGMAMQNMNKILSITTGNIKEDKNLQVDENELDEMESKRIEKLKGNNNDLDDLDRELDELDNIKTPVKNTPVKQSPPPKDDLDDLEAELDDLDNLGGSQFKQTPVKQQPVKQNPFKQTPVKQQPLKQPFKQPVKQQPVKQSPPPKDDLDDLEAELDDLDNLGGSQFKQTPVKQQPVKQNPFKQTPVKQQPLKQPFKQQPVKQSPPPKDDLDDLEAELNDLDNLGGSQFRKTQTFNHQSSSNDELDDLESELSSLDSVSYRESSSRDSNTRQSNTRQSNKKDDFLDELDFELSRIDEPKSSTRQSNTRQSNNKKDEWTIGFEVSTKDNNSNMFDELDELDKEIGNYDFDIGDNSNQKSGGGGGFDGDDELDDILNSLN